jgi:hypothetical protein
VEEPQFFVARTGLYPDRRRLQDDRPSEWQGDLKVIPAVQLDLSSHRDMKAKDGGPRLHGKQDGPLLGDVSWAPGSVNGKGGIAAIPDVVCHLCQSPQAAARTRAAGGAITEALYALRDRFAVQVLAGHDDDATFAPVVGGRKNAPMPKRENRAISRLKYRVQVGISCGFPAHRTADNTDDEIADPADQCGFQAFAAAEFRSRGLHLLEQFRHFFAAFSFADAIGKKNPEARSAGHNLFRRRESC